MEEIRVNRLPMLTYRYLHVNDSPYIFKEPAQVAEPVFSDRKYVRKGGQLPAGFKGASEETLLASARGKSYTITIPENAEAELTISVMSDESHPDFAGQFVFVLEKGSRLRLLWRYQGSGSGAVYSTAAFYHLKEAAQLSVSHLETGLAGASLYEQRNVLAEKEAQADFVSAELGGEKVIVHSYGRLDGEGSGMNESALYAAGGSQSLDLFYHIDHVGKKTAANIDVKGALSGHAKKVFRGTLDFKRGCSGSAGDEGDYAIQLSPTTKNISLPLLLCTEDDVSGNHASSAGQLDGNTIYFLMARGFSLEEARRIVVEALIRPLIDRMDESIREEVLTAVREKLDAKEK